MGQMLCKAAYGVLVSIAHFLQLIRGRFRVGGFAFMAAGNPGWNNKWLMVSGLVEGLEVRRLAERDGWGRQEWRRVMHPCGGLCHHIS
jgi:hypothetical protein